VAPMISVILPTYNRSHSLPAAIASVLTQSVRDLELIVVDDASSEDIRAVLEGMGDTRLRYLRRRQNGGAGAARNSGLAAAHGQFIAFQDSDDLWLPGKLEAQLARLTALPAAFGAVTGPKIFHGRDAHGGHGIDKVSVTPAPTGRLTRDGDQLGALLGDNRLSVQCALFRVDCMPDREWFDECARANEDWEFAVRLVQHTRLYEDPAPVVLGCFSSDSISRSGRRQMIGELRILKHNRRQLTAYRRQRAALLLDVARGLVRDGKPRWGRRFLVASVAHYPLSVVAIADTVRRKLQVRAMAGWRRIARLPHPRPAS
jgi:glycosyltransferase involved in cell wall biosynthesis